ncbi:MAG: LacI family DNA-binding transcriptional regulator [Burkholderiales bacterium]
MKAAKPARRRPSASGSAGPAHARRSGRATTLADVAGAVGVSLNTVSRSLRAPQTVRPELRRRIEHMAEQMDYVPNSLAGGLAGAHTGVVGVIVTSLHYSEFAAVIETMQTELGAAGLSLMIGNSRYQPDEELRLVRSMLGWRPAALAIVGTDHHPRARALLKSAGRPVVEIWDCADTLVDSGVGMDHRAIGALQVDHLIRQGCRRLAFVGSAREHDYRAHKRLEGAIAMARQRRCRALLVATEPSIGHPDMGERLLRDVLARDPAIDGVICNGDVIAHGVLRGLRHFGRRVPQDVAVIGFGEHPSNTCLEPALSSIDPPRVDMGRRAAALILGRIDGEAPGRVIVAPQLIVRASSARSTPD